jgi:hypothetical protein
MVERIGLQSLLSQSQHLLEHQQSVVCHGSLLPASSVESAGLDDAMYQQPRGYQQLYASIKGRMELAEDSRAGSVAIEQGRDMGPPRAVIPHSQHYQQQQQWQQHGAGDRVLHSHTSAPYRPAQSQQHQQQQQQLLVDGQGQWPAPGPTQQQLYQRGVHTLRHTTDQVLDPDSTWDGPDLLPPSTSAQLLHQQPPPSPYERMRLQEQQQVSQQQPLHQWHLAGPAAAEQAADDGWDGAMMDSPVAAAVPADLPRPWQPLQRHQPQGAQVLESAGVSTDIGSIGAMESVELVDTLLQLLGSEQAAAEQQQQQQAAATGALLTQEEQQQLAAAAVQVVKEECMHYAADQHQVQQQDQQQLQVRSGGVLLQQWQQEQESHQLTRHR